MAALCTEGVQGAASRRPPRGASPSHVSGPQASTDGWGGAAVCPPRHTVPPCPSPSPMVWHEVWGQPARSALWGCAAHPSPVGAAGAGREHTCGAAMESTWGSPAPWCRSAAHTTEMGPRSRLGSPDRETPQQTPHVQLAQTQHCDELHSQAYCQPRRSEKHNLSVLLSCYPTPVSN